jgi:hypothetical protein
MKPWGVKGEGSSRATGTAAERHEKWLTVAPGLYRGLRLSGTEVTDDGVFAGADVHNDALTSESLDASHLVTEVVCFYYTQ